ncbi:hypothetical protein [Streptomyces cellulosae]|uniref:Transposase n=1 Tax=Streptomyces cellulosae TaxID=1968 RepID=A0ABW7YCN1_STRCE
MAPVPRDSGHICGNLHKPQRCNLSLRRVFYISAMVAANRPGETRDYHQRKRAEGKRVVQVQIALERRPVNVVWALLRDNRPYAPSVRAAVLAAA